jgi:hypothetical protein
MQLADPDGVSRKVAKPKRLSAVRCGFVSARNRQCADQRRRLGHEKPLDRLAAAFAKLAGGGYIDS